MIFLLLACAGDEPDAAALAFLAPAEGEELPLGESTASLLIENFELQDPAKHNEGLPLGFVRLELDGELVLETGSTQIPFTVDSAGEHTLSAELFYSDGDALDPAVAASLSFLAVDAR